MSTRISLALVAASAGSLLLGSWLPGGDSRAQPAESSSRFCVFTSRPDGSALTFLSRGVGAGWSPTGSLLAIGLIPASGTERVSGTRLVGRDGQLIREFAQRIPRQFAPSFYWEPQPFGQSAWLDDKRVLVTDVRGRSYGIAQLDGAVRNLRLPPRTSPQRVTLATAAKLITVVLNEKGVDGVIEYDRIVLFNAEGRIVATWRASLTGKWEMSPDARRLAQTWEHSVAGRATLVTMRGRPVSYLAHAAARSLTWSPDGKRLAVVLSSTAESDIERAAPGAAGLYIHDVARKRSFRRIVRGEVGYVSWSPKGTRLAYSAAAGLFTVPVTGGAAKRIGSSAGPVTWSPDETQVAYGTDGAIFTTPAAGGAPQQITPVDGYGHPSWSPDGTRIAFTRWLNYHPSAPPCPEG